MGNPDAKGHWCHLLMGGAATWMLQKGVVPVRPHWCRAMMITTCNIWLPAWLSAHFTQPLQEAGHLHPNKLWCHHVLPTRVTLVFILLYLLFEHLAPPAMSHTFVCVGLFICLPHWQETRAFIRFVLCCALSTQAGTWHISETPWILVAHMNFHSADICVDVTEGMFIPGTLNAPQWWTLFASRSGAGGKQK